MKVGLGDVAMMNGEEKNRGLWKIGIIERLIPGRNGVVRAVRLRAGKSHLEKSIQLHYPLELQCEIKIQKGLILKGKRFYMQQRMQKQLSGKELKMKKMNSN